MGLDSLHDRNIVTISSLRWCNLFNMTMSKPGLNKQSHRERIHIVKDIILKLIEYGEINQTTLISFCRLNTKKHRPILEKMEEKELITRANKILGKRTVAIYKCTPKGNAFFINVLEPYERLFPRSVSVGLFDQIFITEPRSFEVNPILVRKV